MIESYRVDSRPDRGEVPRRVTVTDEATLLGHAQRRVPAVDAQLAVQPGEPGLDEAFTETPSWRAMSALVSRRGRKVSSSSSPGLSGAFTASAGGAIGSVSGRAPEGGE